MYKSDTIAAVATPPGEGGVAIIRVSGPDAEQISRRIFVGSSGKTRAFKSHTLYHGRIADPQTGSSLDEVLLAIMRKPRSYTGEDVVEIHCHGGTFLVRQVLALVLSEGARHADRGEFTKRAFLNGRLDLAQAEAVLDLIRARTDEAVTLALTQVDGALSKWVHHIREALLAILVQVEAAIDFPDEEIELLQRRDLTRKVGELVDEMLAISATYDWGRLFREGAKVCICGRPNVGKSSLLNALLEEDRVIVTPFPGTTRDVIEETINLGGLPVVLWDTAGIWSSHDAIERMGIVRSQQHVAKADALLLVLDGSAELQSEDRSLLDSLGGKKMIVVVNKNDLPRELELAELHSRRDGNPIVFVSAKDGDGIAPLKQALRSLVLAASHESDVVLTRLRQRSALERSAQALARAVATLEQEYAAEFVAVDLAEAREALEEIIGAVSSEDILERIFSEFCIGK
jgi:tRNA modification GTPase